MRRAHLSLLFLLLVAPAAGCGDDADEPPTTADFAPNELGIVAEVHSNGYLAQITVSMFYENGYTLKLGAGDELLFAEKGGPEQRLVSADTSHFGQLETSGTDFELIFARGSTRISSPLSIPEPFALSGPATPVSRASPIPVEWGPPGSGAFDTWLEVTGECLSYPITRYFGSVTGSFSVQPADLAVETGTDECDLRVWVTRSASAGMIAPDFIPGVAPGGTQVRSVVIATTP